MHLELRARFCEDIAYGMLGLGLVWFVYRISLGSAWIVLVEITSCSGLV